MLSRGLGKRSNIMSHVILAVTLAIPSVVLLESFIGFLGFAVKPPLMS